MRFKVVLAFVYDKYQDEVIVAAKAAGATGVTILNARGEGISSQKSFLGLNMESQKDMLLFLVEDFMANDIMDAIYESGNLGDHGNGITFSLNVDRAIGLESQMKSMEKEAKDHYF